jgi:hypothetical protein
VDHSLRESRGWHTVPESLACSPETGIDLSSNLMFYLVCKFAAEAKGFNITDYIPEQVPHCWTGLFIGSGRCTSGCRQRLPTGEALGQRPPPASYGCNIAQAPRLAP